MPYELVRGHIRGRNRIRTYKRKIKRRPKGIGTSWTGKEGKYVHGPRILSPNLFKYGPYNWSQKYTKKRRKNIINWKVVEKAHLPYSTKIKVGGLKKPQDNKNLAIQSFLTPKKDWNKMIIHPYKKNKMISYSRFSKKF